MVSLLRALTSSFQKPNKTPRAFVQKIDLLTKIHSTVILDNSLIAENKVALNKSHKQVAPSTFLSGLSDMFGCIEAEQFLIKDNNIAYLSEFLDRIQVR